MKIAVRILSILLSIYVDVRIFQNHYSPILIYWWLSAIIFFILSFINKIKLPNYKIRLTKKTVLLCLLLILPLIVRYLNYYSDRMHPDEVITAYFSAKEDLFSMNFFSGIPRDIAQWVSKFPTPFFTLQRMFFLFAGTSFLTLRLSILPYVFIISLILYQMTKSILNEKAAYVSVIIYSFLAISLFLETLGLHFVSSTAIFMIFLYFAFLYLKHHSSKYAVLSGIAVGFCYLFYLTSYIALPLLCLIYLLEIINKRKLEIVKHLTYSLVGFLIVVGPFFTNALKFENYFLSRISQVSLLTGTWSGNPDRIAKGESPQHIVGENLTLAYKSLYLDGIGGHGGYNFGRLALFDRFTLYLFLTGLFLSLFLVLRKKSLFFVYLIVVLSILTMIFSTPPPAYHRLSIAFPFISLIISVPFYYFFSIKPFKLIRYIIIFIFLSIFIYQNQAYFLTSIKEDHNFEEFKISKYILKYYPERNIYIASYPGFGFDKFFYFYSEGKAKNKVDTAYHDSYLNNFNSQEKYVYVILFPQDFNSKFEALDKNGKIVFSGKALSLFAN